jgi:lysophospholipase L1-like esterase
MKRFAIIALLLFVAGTCRAQDVLPGVNRIVFLGDSITYDGKYVADVETELILRLGSRRFEILDLGLPSETVSGLSEPGHAGGKFPRPDLHERLERVLEKTTPDLVFACYGMNDGIYQPLDEGRFEKFKDGMRWLHETVTARHVKIIHLTPPVFDPVPIAKKVAPADKVDADHPYEGYDDVLTAYSNWLLERRKDGWTVIDLHGPMKRLLAEHRKTDPAFSFSRDGVHPGDEGHLVMAEAVLRGLPTAIVPNDARSPRFQKLDALVAKRTRLMEDQWLHVTGHRRPGMATTMPLQKFQMTVDDLTRRIDQVTRQ